MLLHHSAIIAVVGLGKSGLSSALALKKLGYTVIVWDDQQPSREKAAAAGLDVVDLSKNLPNNITAILLSPGIPLTHPQPHPLVIEAAKLNIPVIGDVEAFFQLRQAPISQASINSASNFIGITGTNGKSTTTSLLGFILEKAGLQPETGGNLGRPVFDMSLAAHWYIWEMSSYQLDLSQKLGFDIAILLNFSPDHLERHGSMEGYITAKSKIFANIRPGSVAIIGVDDEWSANLAQKLHQEKRWNVVEISTKRPVEHGFSVLDGILYRYHAGIGHKITPVHQYKNLRGGHNQQNLAAAYAAAYYAGINESLIQQAMADFPGLAHRQEIVREINGISWVNDSKATNADAAAKALMVYDNIYWIIGGQAKQGGLRGLDAYLPKLRHVWLIGEAMDEFAAWLQEQGFVYITRAGSLEKAVTMIAEKLPEIKGEASILFSPAAASFDQYKNFEERGDHFRTLVQQLELSSC
ncbi:MAG: UDP-N-acetylmuramoyl-L-alanine--D-glutamate ligase [Alphaproteobacteria bacterium]